MKYAVVADRNMSAELSVTTLFDLLGDPSLWLEAHEVVFVTRGPDLPGWVEGVVAVNSTPVLSDFDTITADWVVLGPTDESLVAKATKQGARYLALDEGLVELVLEEGEEKETPIAPDTATAEIEEPTEPTGPVEVPALPKKRRTRQPRAPKVAAVPDPVPGPEELAAILEEPTDEPITKSMVDAQYQTGVTEEDYRKQLPLEEDDAPYVVDQMRTLLHTLINLTDEAGLWELLGAAARQRGGIH